MHMQARPQINQPDAATTCGAGADSAEVDIDFTAYDDTDTEELVKSGLREVTHNEADLAHPHLLDLLSDTVRLLHSDPLRNAVVVNVDEGSDDDDDGDVDCSAF